MTCGSCGRELQAEGARFCPFCGRQAEARAAERRNAIVTFADLSGFTALSQEMESDTLRRLVDSLMRSFVGIVENHGGTVDKIIGDCVMFLFGTEKTSVRDAVRALDAIDALRGETESFNRTHSLDLGLHCGVAYGTVSAGMVGPSRTVIGDTVNLASRLASSGAKNEILVSETFAELFDGEARFERRPSVELKGFRDPVTVYRYAGRIPAAGPVQFFVGREGEVRELCGFLDALRSEKRGKSVLLHGPAGVGKSALLHAVRSEALRKELAAVSLYFEEAGGSLLAPFRRTMRQLIGSPELRGDARAEVWRKILEPAAAEAAPQAQQLQRAFCQVLEAVSARRPVVFFAEDVHRAEPTARFLHQSMIQSLTEAPILFLTTSRIQEQEIGELFPVLPLPEEDAVRLFRKLLRDAAAVPEEVIAPCKGNPFVLREVARALARGVPRERLYSGNVELLLSATLDTFSVEDQELVKRASAFGSRIPLARLAELAGEEPSRIEARIAPMGLFHYLPAENVLFFEHDLLREFAYKRIDRAIRAEWHGRIGDILAGAGAQADEIAFHYLRSEKRNEALRSSLAAGKLLARLPRQEEARTFLSKAHELAVELSDGPALAETVGLQFAIEARALSVPRALALLAALRNDSSLAGKKEMAVLFPVLRCEFFLERRMYQEAGEALGMAAEGVSDLFRAKLLVRTGHHKEAVRTGMRGLRKNGLEPSERGELWNLLGYVSYLDREIVQARDFYESALEQFERGGDLAGLRKAKFNLGNVAYAQDEFLRARQLYEQSAELSLRLGDLVGYCEGLLHTAHVQFDLLEFEVAIAHVSLAIDLLRGGLSENLLNRQRRALAAMLAYLGDDGGASELLAQAVDHFRKTKDAHSLGQTLRSIALLRLHRKTPEEGLGYVDQAIECLGSYATDLQLARLARVELLDAAGRTGEARDEMAAFKKLVPEKRQGQKVRCLSLRLDSVLSRRSERGLLAEIRTLLDETARSGLPLVRLSLLVEALEYGPDAAIASEALALANWIRSRVPEGHRRSFAAKEEIRRLYQITGRGDEEAADRAERAVF